MAGSGFDATRAYRVSLSAPSRLTVRLEIQGSGRVDDREDLDLELRSIRAELIESARTEARVEVVDRDLPAGRYIVYVRDGGQGNRADFALRVAATPR